MENFSYKSRFIRQFRPHIKEDTNILSDTSVSKFHYTSPQAFMSIIKNKSIRFTDINYMNDKSENIYLIKLLLEFMEEFREEYVECSEILYDLLKYNDLKKLKELSVNNVEYNLRKQPVNKWRRFILCMCDKADLLHMWNYYANNGQYQGYNIGFNINNILKSIDYDFNDKYNGSTIYYGNVIYKVKNQKEEIKLWFDAIEFQLKNKMCKDEMAKHLLLSYINTYACFFKNPCFEPENEFRIVFVTPEMREYPELGELNKNFEENEDIVLKGNRKILSFFERNGIIVPCIEIPLPNNAISRITMSPMIEYELAKKSIKEFLKCNDFSDVKIFKSKIPIRF